MLNIILRNIFRENSYFKNGSWKNPSNVEQTHTINMSWIGKLLFMWVPMMGKYVVEGNEGVIYE